jgi:demethylmenaquinone methyltransferase/2-methoxy-6-polyprenyl-1,4-benzoquinol methylase
MKKEEYVYQVFENIAEDYDAANQRISLGQQMKWKKRAVERLLEYVPVNGAVLDLCCGTGDMTMLMLRLRPDIKVTALDFSPSMLGVAKERLKKFEDINFVQGDAMNLPFEDECYDGVIISFALRNTADYRKVLGEIARVLKCGGGACCIDSFQPEAEIIKPFYHIYFSKIMPLLGGGIRKKQEYRWLCQSTKDYVSPSQLEQMMLECGLTRPQRDSFMFGSCVSICTVK